MPLTCAVIKISPGRLTRAAQAKLSGGAATFQPPNLHGFLLGILPLEVCLTRLCSTSTPCHYTTPKSRVATSTVPKLLFSTVDAVVVFTRNPGQGTHAGYYLPDQEGPEALEAGELIPLCETISEESSHPFPITLKYGDIYRLPSLDPLCLVQPAPHYRVGRIHIYPGCTSRRMWLFDTHMRSRLGGRLGLLALCSATPTPGSKTPHPSSGTFNVKHVQILLTFKKQTFALIK